MLKTIGKRSLEEYLAVTSFALAPLAVLSLMWPAQATDHLAGRPPVVQTNLQATGQQSRAQASVPVNQGLPPRPEMRQVKFPEGSPLGTLFLIKSDFGGTRDLEDVVMVGPAKGTVKVAVAPNQRLMLDFNRLALTHPEIVEDASAQGVDAVKISFRVMLDTDVNIDKLMEHVPHFRDIEFVDLDHSDAKDVSIEKWKDMPKLKCLHAMICHIHGNCFKRLSAYRELDTLCLDYNPIDTANLVYLQKMPKLRRLNLTHCALTPDAATFIGKCSSLVDLSISDNPKIDDNCVKHLLKLNNLWYLHLSKTSITNDGLKPLAALPLKTLELPKNSYTRDELTQIHKIFPHTLLKVDPFEARTKERMKWVYMNKYKD